MLTSRLQEVFEREARVVGLSSSEHHVSQITVAALRGKVESLDSCATLFLLQHEYFDVGWVAPARDAALREILRGLLAARDGVAHTLTNFLFRGSTCRTTISGESVSTSQ